MRFGMMLALAGLAVGLPALAPSAIVPQAQAQAATDASTLPALTPQLQLMLNQALLGTPAQVRAKMAALMRANQSFAVALAANAAARNPDMAADFAGIAAGNVPPAELGALYNAVGRAAPDKAANIATEIRASVPGGTDLASLESAVIQGISSGSTGSPQPVVVQQRVVRRQPPPPTEPVVPEVFEPNPEQAGSPV